MFSNITHTWWHMTTVFELEGSERYSEKVQLPAGGSTPQLNFSPSALHWSLTHVPPSRKIYLRSETALQKIYIYINNLVSSGYILMKLIWCTSLTQQKVFIANQKMKPKKKLILKYTKRFSLKVLTPVVVQIYWMQFWNMGTHLI